MKETLRYAWKEIKRRKNRNIWNILGYIIAVAFLIITLSFADFSNRGASSALNYTGAQFIGIIYATSPQDTIIHFIDPDHEGWLVFNNPTVLFPLALVDEIKQSPNVKNAAPLLTFTIITDIYVNRSWILAGFDPADMESVRMTSCSSTDIVEGRLIQPGDTGVVLLEQMELGERLNNLPVELSVGQQQRVALARALINEPSLIIADEPTGNVDEATANDMLNILIPYVKEKKSAIVVTTHGQFTGMHLANRIFQLKDRKLI